MKKLLAPALLAGLMIAAPAAALVCPIIDLTEPKAHHDPSRPLSP